MSEIQDNEILADCAWFADKHRGKNKQSGPYWSTIIRFPKLYDEAARLQERVDTLEDYIADYCSPISDKYSEIERLQQRVQELEQERRWIPVSEPPEKNNIEVICYSLDAPDYKSYFADYIDGKFVDVDCSYHEIYPRPTHYQYKPQPPEEE